MGCKNSNATAADKPEKKSKEKTEEIIEEQPEPVPEKVEEQSEEVLIAPKPKGIGLHGFYDVDAAPFDGDNLLNLSPEYLTDFFEGEVFDDN